MQSGKYYHYKLHRYIDPVEDGCDLCDWEARYGKALFAKHPKDFPVFLSPRKLDKCDEYSDSDPYTVKVNIDNDFHKRKIQCTVEMVEKSLKLLRRQSRILDLGCGQGHITSIVKRSCPDIEISGLDYSVSAIEYAVDHFPEVDFAVGDAYECPYGENYFDIIICNNLWEHVPDPLFLLSRIKRILKPSGFLIISTPSRYRMGNLLRVLLGKPVKFMSKHHVTEYSIGQVVEQLRYGGFNVVETLSKPIKSGGGIMFRLVKSMFSFLLSITRSHHQLESTVFFLAESIKDNVRQKTIEQP